MGKLSLVTGDFQRNGCFLPSKVGDLSYFWHNFISDFSFLSCKTFFKNLVQKKVTGRKSIRSTKKNVYPRSGTQGIFVVGAFS